MFSRSSLARIRPGRRQSARGQELVEFTILVTFFLIVFFCTLQVCFTAMEKFYLNHYALYSARTWSTCPCALSGNSLQVNESLARVKLAEWLKKTATSRNMTDGDWWRVKWLWAIHSSDIGGLSGYVLPNWVEPGLTGPIFLEPIPMRMPYSSMVMGGTLTLNLGGFVPPEVTSILNALGITIPSMSFPLQKVGGYSVALASTFIPMEREPGETPGMPGDCDDCWDNDGYPDDQLAWTDLVGL